MVIGLDVSGDYDRWQDCVNDREKNQPDFSEVIFSFCENDVRFAASAVFNPHRSPIDQKTTTAFVKSVGQEDVMLVGDVKGRAEAGVDLEWGGKEPPKVKGYVEGEIKKDGSYVKGRVEQDKDGKGKGRIAAGKETQDKSK